MSETAVSVENLSKSYLVGHQLARRDSYMALRDVIAREAKNFARKSFDMLRGRQIVEGDEIEEFWALKNVSFEIKKGEVVGFIGRNGAGKSTLLKILSRITEPTSGRVRISGRVASLLEIGTGFHAELTGRENIFLNGAILGMTRAEINRKFDEIIAFADIERFLDTPVKRYSSGMYIRLAFAVAAHLEPEILIVDEVLAVGDAEFQKKCLGKMQSVSVREGRTVLFVSHNMGAVTTLCPRSVWLQEGSVIAFGPTSDIIGGYLSQGVQGQQRAIDLEGLPRNREYDRRLRLTAIEWLGELPLRHGAPARLRIHFRTTAPLEFVSLGIGFSNLEGRRFLRYETDWHSDTRRNIGQAGKYSIDLAIDALPLTPEVYNMDIGSRSGDSYVLDLVNAGLSVEVSGGGPAVRMLAREAGVRLPGAWSWNV